MTNTRSKSKANPKPSGKTKPTSVKKANVKSKKQAKVSATRKKNVSKTSGTPAKKAKTLCGSKSDGDKCPKPKDHGLDDGQYASIIEEVYMNLDDEISLVGSGTSQEASHSLVDCSNVQNLSPTLYTCERCFKILKSKHGFIKHKINHRIMDVNSKRPSVSILNAEIEKIILKALEAISLEYGEEKRKFVKGVLQTAEDNTDDWRYFIDTISSPFLDSISKASKLMPSNQYGEQLVNMNKVLNEEETYESLLCALKKLNEDISVPQHVSRMVLYRLCVKLVDSLAVFVFKEMRGTSETVELESSPAMSDNEIKAFIIHMRKLVQLYYRRGLKRGSKLWLTRCACIRQSFIDHFNSSDPPTVDAVLSEESWEEDDCGVTKLQLNDKVIKFFLFLERIIKNKLESQGSKCDPINVENVLDVVFDSVNEGMLEIWCNLTVSYFSENESLVLMRDFASLIISLALRLEVKRKHEAMATERLQKYALRTDLKRN